MKNENWKMTNGKWVVAFATLLFLAAAFRISVAHWLPNDSPDDGRVYAQIARNVLEQHVYSHDPEQPFNPSLIRLPGYPLFLASIYSVFGHTNNGAVRIIQALVDTATCGLIGVLAFYWQPDEKKKRATALAALTLAVVCPFTTIYTATILTEVLTNFLLVALLIAATLAMRKLTTEDTEEDRNKKRLKKALGWWCAAGLIGGVAVMMRPDAGLFLAAVGVTLVITGLRPLVLGLRKTSKAQVQRPKTKTVFTQLLISGATLSVAFILVLTPWTIRNWHVFHLFQPLAPAHAEMPGEFVPRGYLLWVRSWLDDQKYVAQFLWPLEVEPIDVDELPDSAFDSPEEKKRIATLFEKYNNPDESQGSETDQTAREPSTGPTPTPSPNQSTESTKPNPTASPTPDENDEKDESEDSVDQEESNVELTPDVDAGFMKIARERIARHPFRHYVRLPIRRARSMWFDTHSQYWPFEGELLPLDDLDYDIHQQFWLPLFAGLTAIYTLLGLAGAWVLFRARNFVARPWLLLVVLAIGLRVVLFASLENPEPRYFVEFFPILSVLGGLFIARILARDRVKPAPQP
jgi:Dolichyl-phosphate-mannose-protein mannosyltransferase